MLLTECLPGQIIYTILHSQDCLKLSDQATLTQNTLEYRRTPNCIFMSSSSFLVQPREEQAHFKKRNTESRLRSLFKYLTQNSISWYLRVPTCSAHICIQPKHLVHQQRERQDRHCLKCETFFRQILHFPDSSKIEQNIIQSYILSSKLTRGYFKRLKFQVHLPPPPFKNLIMK